MSRRSRPLVDLHRSPLATGITQLHWQPGFEWGSFYDHFMYLKDFPNIVFVLPTYMSLDAKSLYSNQSRPAHDSEKASLENNHHHEQNHHCEHGQTNTSRRNIRLRRLLLPTILALVVLGGLILTWRSFNWYGLSSQGLGVANFKLVGRGIHLPESTCQYLS